MGLSAILRFGKKVCNLAPELILGTGSETMGAAMKKAKGSIFMKADAGVKALAKDVAKKQATEGRFIKRLGKNIVSTPKDLYNGSKLAAKAAKAAGKSGIWGGVKGFFKGVAKKMPLIGALVTIGFEIPNIITAAKEKGIGQAVLEAGKSCARLGGGAAGAAIGSAICPGIGSIVGWIVGEWVAGRIVGKSYTEQKEEAQEQQGQAQPTKYSQEEISQLKQLGLSDEEIAQAQQNGYSMNEILEFIQKETQQTQPTKYTRAEIAQLKQLGLSDEEIAQVQQNGFTVNEVIEYVKEKQQKTSSTPETSSTTGATTTTPAPIQPTSDSQPTFNMPGAYLSPFNTMYNPLNLTNGMSSNNPFSTNTMMQPANSYNNDMYYQQTFNGGNSIFDNSNSQYNFKYQAR